jgi:hypothetical protein
VPVANVCAGFLLLFWHSYVPPVTLTDGTYSSASHAPSSDVIPSLIVIGMTMAPVPVLALRFVVLFGIHMIRLVMFGQITTIRAVFMVIPVMVVLVVPIIDAELNANCLGPRSSYH